MTTIGRTISLEGTPDALAADSLRDRRPASWASRALYVGLQGARNWLNVAHDAAYPLNSEDHFGLKANRLAVLRDVRVRTVVSLGPGDGLPDIEPVAALKAQSPQLRYLPVDLSPTLLDLTIQHLEPWVQIPVAVVADFEVDHAGIADVLARHGRQPCLFMLLGGTIGNLDLGESAFVQGLRRMMGAGDRLLLDVPLAGPGWTAADEPRLQVPAYTDAFRRFLGGAALPQAPPDDVGGFVRHFADRVRLSLSEGQMAGARTIEVFDRPSDRVLLRFTRYDWQSLLRWFPAQDFRVVTARCSLAHPTDRFGMGVALVAVD